MAASVDSATSDIIAAISNTAVRGVAAFIVAGGPQGASCHHHGSGELRSGQPVIVDIFPMDNKTRYCGDMTRTVVCGEIPDEIHRMHLAVSEAKAAGCAALRSGTTGEAVHNATIEVILKHGYLNVRGSSKPDPQKPGMPHGTGHGIGLDVHEALRFHPDTASCGILEAGMVMTVEPGIYIEGLGGVRLENDILVTENGCEVFGSLDLDWAVLQ